MEGGPLAIIRNGDMISIDIPRRKIELLLTAGEISERMKQWRPPAPKIQKGYLSRYAKMVSSAGKGAIMLK
jgi:dihydroxy-acid dehydratase